MCIRDSAKNAGILAARILSIGNQTVQKNLENYEKSLVEKVSDMQDELE